ncbi:uncharacterized protein LOC144906461 isoform X2 [Branchiostoma floridae x Branchiostoma belcheri]
MTEASSSSASVSRGVWILHVTKCSHLQSEKKTFKTLPGNMPISSAIDIVHPPPGSMVCGRVMCGSGQKPTEWVDVEDTDATLSQLEGFGFNHLKIQCTGDSCEEAGPSTVKSKGATVSAFDVLMSPVKVPPPKKTSSSGQSEGLNRKDELFNDLVSDFTDRGCLFARDQAGSEGSYIIQVLCNSLWYVTNQHVVINDAALRKKSVTAVPVAFDKYQGYNDYKRKKTKAQQMSSTQLNSHAQALYSLCNRPVMKSSAAWVEAHNDIEKLADCLSAYREHLDKMLESQAKRHESDHPVRELENNCSVEHRTSSSEVRMQYRALDKRMQEAEYHEPVLFDEDKHLVAPFENSVQRHRFIASLQLSCPVDLYRYVPGGSLATVLYIVKVEETRSQSELLTQAAKVMATIRPRLPQIHTRQMLRHFKQHLSNIAHIAPSVADLIYKELALDEAAASHPETQQRLKLVFLGETGLMTDMRAVNPGRPGGTYDAYFEQLKVVVDEVTAADDRRHNVAHFSQWLSLKDLMQKTEERCPEGTPTPSSALVRLQFSPRNPYLKTATRFTSKIDVQYKIQRRQLRAFHPDAHYCACLLKYLKQMAVLLSGVAVLFFCDDKAKVPVGDPDLPISTGVRGKKTLAPSKTTLSAADHDLRHKGSLTPSVYHQCDIPEDADKSFYRGTVTVVVNDSVFQASSPFRHTAAILKILRQKKERPKVFLKYSDGGTDQRNTLDAVKCAHIALFKLMNFDMLTLVRCAPGQSYINPAERLMSILNIGLQNVALERKPLSEELEKLLTRAGSMADVRRLAQEHPELAEGWRCSIESVQALLLARFSRLALKDKPFQVMDPVSQTEIEELFEMLKALFPDLDVTKLQKQHTKKSSTYTNWLQQHCRQTQYSFQVRKCQDASCCEPPTLGEEQLRWLPEPQLDPSGDHYLPFKEVYPMDTTEVDRPTLVSARSGKRPASVLTVEDEVRQMDANKYTAQNGRAVVECIECRKPRLVYSERKLTERQKTSLACLYSEYEYSCGSVATPPDHLLHSVVFVRTTLTCESRIETAFYGSECGRSDLCCYCASPNAEVNEELKSKYKTVLPLCPSCANKGCRTVCFRPIKK